MIAKINNKGFTLVELLAVMVILVSISLVAVGGVASSLTRREVKECKEQQELAVGTAKIYFSLYDVKSVTIGELKDNGYFKDYDKVDGLDDVDEITISTDKYLYNGVDVGVSCEKK